MWIIVSFCHYLRKKFIPVLRHFVGSKGLVITHNPQAYLYSGSRLVALLSYYNAKWACPHTKKGLSTLDLHFGLISWTLIRESHMALSITENEFTTQAVAVQEATRLTPLLAEIGICSS
ncbi:hypothetical protein PDIP_87740 [Penicillium digitatum Pd1]|uniref:Uncharacterized protein n=1 Tax=Penicillium digitatum (strain Pd1 / CECT 20795) TaxID=1170230 RepID=K9FTK0_PEND1|nr:hypothetical protein PDIP_87740 [Penicillium digitatum Pd1]EKV04376.1 hypothetical protein PDIP_87740 [Penicillium digitatum Pd1]